MAAVVLLLAAVAAWALALRATALAQRGGGASALLATASGEVWMGVDDRLWRISLDGALQHDDALADLGLPRAPANLVQAPDGRIVATVRDDPTLYLLDAASARVIGRIVPQWPADIAQHAGRAINLAVHADGRFAIATGAGHLVALFGPQGAFLGRTAPQTYRYSNGLWWIGDALWTTDTNRFQLKRLDPASLAVVQTLTLPADAAARFLGPARRHPQTDDPMAALVRYQNGMTVGGVVVVSRDGHETLLAHAPFEPRDVAWLGEDVIATDGVTRQVLRWRADGTELARFGDAELTDRLARGASERDAAERLGRLLRIASASVFLVALGCALRARQLQRAARAAAAPLDLSQLGTPQLDRAELLRRQLAVYGAWMAMGLPLLAFQLGNGLGLLHVWLGPVGAMVLLATMIAGCALAGWLILRRQRRLAQALHFEPVFNAAAMMRLADEDALGAALRPGEVVVETFIWMRPPRPRWMVLSSERLLQFHNGLGGWKLDSALERPAIGEARLKDQRLALRLADGRILKGTVLAPTVAARVVQALTAR